MQKHVHTRLLWIQEQVEQGRIGIQRVGTRESDNEADILTKPLPANVVRRHLKSLGFKYRTTWSQLHRSLETPALCALDSEGAATAANSAQDRGVPSYSVRQRVEALEAQLLTGPAEDAEGAWAVSAARRAAAE
eukprot:6490642-Amphidinium_carterae.3